MTDIVTPFKADARLVHSVNSTTPQARGYSSWWNAFTGAAATQTGGPLSCTRRTFHLAIQGRFKQPIPAEDLVSGQEFPKAPRLSAG